MQNHIFVGTTEEMESVRKFVSSSKYYNKYYTLNIFVCSCVLYTFISVQYRKFSLHCLFTIKKNLNKQSYILLGQNNFS